MHTLIPFWHDYLGLQTRVPLFRLILPLIDSAVAYAVVLSDLRGACCTDASVAYFNMHCLTRRVNFVWKIGMRQIFAPDL